MTAIPAPLTDPARLPRRRVEGAEGTRARDRLITTLVLATLLHGMVVLGVSFTAPASDAKGTQGMEILLVTDELRETRRNDSATYLSQRTQKGSGNTQERLTARLPGATPAAPPRLATTADKSGEQVLATTTTTRTRLRMVALANPAVTPVPQAAPQPPEKLSAEEESLRLRGEARDELFVTADTKASRLAPYLNGWRQRVERIGTINYPSVARRRGLTGNPVIEVAVQRDGKLKSARVQRSSGRPEIDAAALDILRLASPFDPFPPDLAPEYRTIRFVYEWRFEGAEASRRQVIVP